MKTCRQELKTQVEQGSDKSGVALGNHPNILMSISPLIENFKSFNKLKHEILYSNN